MNLEDKKTCSYKATIEDEYKRLRAGEYAIPLQPSHGDHHTCGHNDSHIVSMEGDAWDHPPAELICGMVAVSPTTGRFLVGVLRLSSWIMAC